MKIFCLSALALWLVILNTANADYRYKMGRPMGPPPPRQHMPQHMPHHMPHHMPPYHKKYHGPPPPQLQQHGPRVPLRPRPVPNHHINPKGPNGPIGPLGPKGPLPNINFPKRPQLPPQNAPLQVSTNVNNVWKSPQNNFNSIKIHQEKPFVSSPTVPKNEFDFHLQTNQIPNHLNTIKQVDEKGPIHTIPAPKLSPADKPKIIEEVKLHHKEPLQQQQQLHQAQPVHTIVQVQKAHQYQVTEVNDNQKPFYYKQEHPEHIKSQELTQSIKIKPGSYSNANVYQEPLPTELFKVINSYPQQQQLLDTYPLPILQQPQLQQHLTQQGSQQILINPQLYEKQVGYSTQIQHEVVPNDKIQVQADFQAYNFDPSGLEDSEPIIDGVKYVQTKRADYGDELAQTQYVQNYFDTRDESLEVQPDAKPSQETYTDGANNEENVFYAALPNKKAADALASLQEAGKVNSISSPKKATHKMPMTIYVPDEIEEKVDDLEELQDDASKDDDSRQVSFGSSQPKSS